MAGYECALARIRTWDTRFRKPVLYPLSYEGLPRTEEMRRLRATHPGHPAV